MKNKELSRVLAQAFYNDVKMIDGDIAGKLQIFISETLSRLALLESRLNGDYAEFSKRELSGMDLIINEVFALLSMAEKIYFEAQE